MSKTIEQLSPVLETNNPPWELKKHLSMLSKAFTKSLATSRSQFLASNYEQLFFINYPSPIILKPAILKTPAGNIEALMIEYRVDGNPYTASGIMHKESLALYQDLDGIKLMLFSPSFDTRNSPKATVVIDKKTQKEARQLSRALIQASLHAQSHMRALYNQKLYPAEQMFATYRLLRGVENMLKEPPRSSISSRFSDRRAFVERISHRMHSKAQVA
jgi:hypothetical protein